MNYAVYEIGTQAASLILVVFKRQNYVVGEIKIRIPNNIIIIYHTCTVSFVTICTHIHTHTHARTKTKSLVQVPDEFYVIIICFFTVIILSDQATISKTSTETRLLEF